MKKNALFIGLILFFIIALCFAFYPKDEKNISDTAFSAPEKKSEKPVKPVETADIIKKTEKVGFGLKASFDIVRVEEDGSMVAAGKGEKGEIFQKGGKSRCRGGGSKDRKDIV